MRKVENVRYMCPVSALKDMYEIVKESDKVVNF
jgi:sulfur relay (sulfurtransferase) complex TusBCD TusD component (DsrE family)